MQNSQMFTTRRQALLIIHLLVILAAGAAHASSDYQDYPGASLREHSSASNTLVIAHAAALRKLGQEINSENMLLLNVREYSLKVLQLPNGHQLQFAEQWYRQQLPADAEILFACLGRACGSDSLWANHIFDDRNLVGDIDSQRYFIAAYQQDGKQYHAIFYAITRLTRANLVRWQVLESL